MECRNDTQAVFPQSVASGGPTPEGVLVWTRLSPEAYAGGPLVVEVSRDGSFTEPIHETVESSAIAAAHDHTVTVDLDGQLSPDSEYAYRFIYDGTASQTGRCRTLPRPGASVECLRFVVLSCQDYQNGYFGAYSHVADEDADFLLHLGDFIYESAAGQYTVPWSDGYDGRGLSLPSGHDIAHTLADYRYLYNTYRSDPHLQRALERHTLIAGWDDHEVGNNWYWEYATDSPQLPSHPLGDDPEQATQITAAAIRAWVEQLPARVEYEPAGGSAVDLHETVCLQRQFRFGDLTTLLLTDERLFRDPPPTFGEGDDRDQTMLGVAQREWFLDAIATAKTTWTTWANEVLTMALKVGPSEFGFYLNKDAWDGYRREREAIMRRIERSDTQNFITLTGDLHSALAGYQRTGYDCDGERVGVEFMTPPVTSVNLAEIVPGTDELPEFDITERSSVSSQASPDDITRIEDSGQQPEPDGSGDIDKSEALVDQSESHSDSDDITGTRSVPVSNQKPLASGDIAELAVTTTNPHIEFFDSSVWGYAVVEFTPEACTYTAYSVDKSANDPGRKRPIKTLRVPEGRTEINTIE